MTEIHNFELSTIELKKHFNNLINALTAICPTRNYISQFLLALPEEYALMYDSFPEFLSDKLFRSQLQYALGLTIGSEIQSLPDSFAKNLIELIKLTFKIFNNDKWLPIWNDFLGDIRSDKIPNPFQEWILAKIQLAIQDPIHGKIAFKVLKVICENQSFIHPSDESELQNNTLFKRGVKLDEIISALQISKFELETTIHFLMNKLKIIQIIPQKNEDNSEFNIVFLADSIKVEWLNDLLKKDSP